MSEQELFKAMESGQLMSAEVLPKVADELRRAAKEGGAYELALKGLRVTEGQFATGAQRAAKTIFNSGFEKGLSNLYKTMSEIFENSEPQLKKLGKIFGDVFNGITRVLKIIEPIMKLAIDNFYTLFGFYALSKITLFANTLNKASWVAAGAWARMFAPIAAGIALVDELWSMMDDNRVGALEGASGMQINLLTGKVSGLVEKDGGFYNDPNGSQDWQDVLTDRYKNRGAFGMLKDSVDKTLLFQSISSLIGNGFYSDDDNSVSTSLGAEAARNSNVNIVNHNSFNNSSFRRYSRVYF